MNLMNEMLQAIKDRDGERARALLTQDPGLLEMQTDAGSLILTAVYAGAEPVVEALLAAAPELNIFEAAATGQADRIRALLAAGTKQANSYNDDGFTPLGLAAFFGHPDAVAALLERGALVSAYSQSKVSYVPSNTPLHAALAGKRNREVIERLLAAGADLEAMDSNGMTPLQVAAYNGDVALGELLIGAGARPGTRGRNGKTALDVATEQGKEQFAAMLRRYGA